jgi:hypothetical protein
MLVKPRAYRAEYRGEAHARRLRLPLHSLLGPTVHTELSVEEESRHRHRHMSLDREQ